MSERPPGYDAAAYPPFAVTADVALFTIRGGALEVLLIRRGGEPYRGAWALPGGFVRVNEDPDAAAARELAEETGLAGGPWHLEQLAAYGAPDRDPRMRVVTIAYWAVCARLPAPRGGGDATAAALLPVAAVESGALRLAFDHERIVRDAVDRIRARLEHTALAAGFCPPAFTIRQLREVYETVWGVRLDPGNFHRSVRESEAFQPWAEAPSRTEPGALMSYTPRAERSMRAPPLPPEQRAWTSEQRDLTDISASRAPSAPPFLSKQHDLPDMPESRALSRGRPASLWTARRTDGGLPVMARTIARPPSEPGSSAGGPAVRRRDRRIPDRPH